MMQQINVDCDFKFRNIKFEMIKNDEELLKLLKIMRDLKRFFEDQANYIYRDDIKIELESNKKYPASTNGLYYSLRMLMPLVATTELPKFYFYLPQNFEQAIELFRWSSGIVRNINEFVDNNNYYQFKTDRLDAVCGKLDVLVDKGFIRYES